MGSFKNYLLMSEAIGYVSPYVVGKHMCNTTYVHKDYVGRSRIPAEAHAKAKKALDAAHPNFDYNIVKHDAVTGHVSFLHSPDWDSAHEPHIKDSMLVKADGSTKYMGPKKDPQIYHQKWAFVGSDYKGFDVEQSKRRTQQYQAAIEKVKAATGDPRISSKIGQKSYWEKNIVPHITESSDIIAAHIRQHNPHKGTARDAESAVRLSDHDWDNTVHELDPNDKRLQHSTAYSKRDVNRYAKSRERGSDFPPIVVAQDHYAPEKRLMVLDGAHRLDAARKLGVSIKAYIGKVRAR